MMNYQDESEQSALIYEHDEPEIIDENDETALMDEKG